MVVCGGGPAGYAAALAASRSGAKVLLVEGQGQLGGMATSGLVSHWLGGRFNDGRWVVGGIFKELTLDAVEAQAALIPENDPNRKYTPYGQYKSLLHGIPLDPYATALLLDRKAAAENIDVLLHTQAVDVLCDGDRITHVIIHNKSGLSAAATRCVIDATGDADVAARAGCGFDKGDENGDMTPVTLEVHVDNVAADVLARYIDDHDAPRLRALIQEMRAAGEWTLAPDIFISIQLTEAGVMMLNTTRICGIDGTDGASVTRGMQQGREDLDALMTFAERHIPGFEHARVKAVAPLLGVRETRRVHGVYRMTVQDLVEGKAFADTIGFSMYGWDLPNPKRPSDQPMEGKPKPPVTPIPYGIMVPKAVSNLICPGRAVSVERDVLGPLRVMAPCMAMGEAAGVAAKQVVHNGKTFAAVDTTILRDTLRDRSAIVDWD